ncbi:TadE/TadG family type IV pilus assembly protein [Streptomyces sp. NPDC000410]|uniref:TadE/TadG family type IV pilus assembly protein n=1 Tax=Streptomyces sp. NPDC000410 TaxID=3154254 RepID=UPI0033344F6B
MSTERLALLRPGRRHRGRDRGQTAVEFVGMLPIILGTCVVLWQAVLFGYAYTLAGNVADEAAHTAAVRHDYQDRQAQCDEGAREGLADRSFTLTYINCTPDGAGQVQAKVKLAVPVLFPGFIDFPFTVPGEASSPEEG